MGGQDYRAEFRYVFYAAPGRYDETVRFYHETLEFPIVGGFTNGTYIQCGVAIVEIIDGAVVDDFQRKMMHGASAYSPPRGGFLVIEVSDLEGTYRHLQDANATILIEPTDYSWRFRQITALDPSGNLLSLFCRLPGWEAHHANAQ